MVKAGEKVLLLGPNGAGKTTLLQIFGRLLTPCKGNVYYKGRLIEKWDEKVIRREMGFLFQTAEDQLIMPTVLEDVMFGLLNSGFEKDEAERRAREAIRVCGLEALAERHPLELSIGEKKKVALAGVLSLRPKLLLLDEPTAGLDFAGKKSIISFLKSLDCGMLIATHDIESGLRITGRVVVLNRRVCFNGTAPELFSTNKVLEENQLEIPSFLRVYSAGVSAIRKITGRYAREKMETQSETQTGRKTYVPATVEEAVEHLAQYVDWV